MRFFEKKSWLWAVDKPSDVDFEKWNGHHIRVSHNAKNEEIEPKVVEINQILGSLAHPTKFQIDTVTDGVKTSYFVSMLDFYAQVNGETVTPEMIKEFDATIFNVKRNPMKKEGGLWLPNNPKKPN